MNLFAEQQWRRRHREHICGHRGRRGETNWKSYMETYTLPYVKERASGTQEAQPMLCDYLRGRGGVGDGREVRMCACGWFKLMYGRSQHNIVKRLSSNTKLTKKVTSISCFFFKLKGQTFQKYEATLELCIHKFVLNYT